MDTEPKPKNKGGRPRKHAESTRRPTLGFRVRDDLREKLELSAKDGNRSISEEIERRLLASYERAEDPLVDTAINLIANNWKALQAIMGAGMFEDRKVLMACADAAQNTIVYLDNIRRSEPQDVYALSEDEAKLSSRIGRMTSTMQLLYNTGQGSGELFKDVVDIVSADVAALQEQKRQESLALAHVLREEIAAKVTKATEE